MTRHSVAGIVVIDSLVLIGRRLPEGQMGNRWEFPGGKAEKGETDEEALLREYKEEFSIDVRIGKCIANTEFKHNGEVVPLFAYEVFLPEGDISWVLAEHTDISWVPFDTIEKLNFVDSDLLLLDQIRKYHNL